MPEQRWNSAPLIALLLIAAGAAMPGIVTRFPTRTPEVSTLPKSAATKDVAPAASGVAELLTQSLGLESNSSPAQILGRHNSSVSDGHQPTIEAYAPQMNNLHSQAPKLQIDFLLVTIPDPIDSHLRLTYDNLFASLQSAIESRGYLFDRYSLTWKNWLRQNTTKAPKTFDYREHPGVIVFRDPRQSKLHRLVVLLVGETPTAGVHSAALIESLNVVANWMRVAQQNRPIAILGPTFSGSARSLRQVLESWSKARLTEPGSQEIHITICTGSATSRSIKKTLQFRTPRLTASFEATVIPDEVSLDKVIRYFQTERNIPTRKIAILSEAGTAYGRGAASIPDEVIQLRFPPQIGRLRSEYEKVPDLRSAPAAAEQKSAHSTLPLTFDQNPFAIDTLPIFSDETAVEIERELVNTLSTISRRDVRALGIMATDVNDILFLAMEVRNYSPDVQLFAIENDLLYTSRPYKAYTGGMLVASTYPLFPNSQSWTGSSEVLPFASNSAEGVYNAALVLLKGLKRALGSVDLVDAHTPFWQSDKPPLWLTIVGREGMWPVKLWGHYRNTNADKYVHTEKALTNSRDLLNSFPSGVYPFVISTLGIGCVCLLFLANPQLRNTPTWCYSRFEVLCQPVSEAVASWNSRDWTAFAPLPNEVLERRAIPAHPENEVRGGSLTTAAARCGSLLFLSMFLINVQIGAPLWNITFAGLYRFTEHKSAFLVLAINLIAVFLLGFSVWRLQWVLPTRNGQRWQKWRKLGCDVVIVLAMISFVIMWWIPRGFWHKEHRVNAAIFAERLGTYTSGVSPLVATMLLISVIGLWAYCHLRRLRLIARFNTCAPIRCSHSVEPGQEQHLAGIDTRTTELLEPITNRLFLPQKGSDYAFFAGILISFFYVFCVRWSGTAEGRLLDCYFIVAAIFAVSFTAGLYFRLTAVAGLFERLLRRIGQHALTDVLKSVPARLARKTAGNILSAAPHLGDYEQSIRLLAQLANECDKSPTPIGWYTHAPRLADDLAIRPTATVDETLGATILKQSKLASDLFVQLTNLQRTDRLKAYELGARLNGILSHVSAGIAPELASMWSARAVERKEDDRRSTESTTSAPSKAELFIAMQFTHFFRQIFAHIQNLMTFVVLMSLLLLWSLNSYPFQPHRLILAFSYAIVVFVALTCLVIFIKFNRDEVLSRLDNSTPNRFTLDRSFIFAAITYVVIPFLGIAAVQFPELGDTLFSWIGFIQKSIH